MREKLKTRLQVSALLLLILIITIFAYLFATRWAGIDIQQYVVGWSVWLVGGLFAFGLVLIALVCVAGGEPEDRFATVHTKFDREMMKDVHKRQESI